MRRGICNAYFGNITSLNGSRRNTKMNKTKALLGVLLISISLVHAQKFILNSQWRDSAIMIDGSSADWDLPLPYFDSKSKLQYSVVNDAKYIYISIRTADDKAQMKIMRAGMDVWFDVTGKKKEVATVHFPLKTDPKLDMNPDPVDMEQQVVEKPDARKMKSDWSAAIKDIHTQGLKNIPATITQADSGKYGIQADINWDRTDVLIYELKVPLSAIYKNELTASDIDRPITIGIKVYAMDLPLIPTNTAADVTGAAGAGGGMNSGMGNNGMNGGMPNSMANSGRPQTSSPQPTMAIPKVVADMGMPLVVSMKLKLAYR